MSFNNIYISIKKPKRYFYIGTIKCVHCARILPVGIACILWEHENQPKINFFCEKCSGRRASYGFIDLPSGRTITSFFAIYSVPEKPIGVRPYIPFAPEFKSGHISLAMAADQRFDNKLLADTSAGYEIEDYTIHAGRESFEGSQIGVSPKEAIGLLDRPIDAKDVDKYLLEIKKGSEKLIAEEEKKLLGVN